MTSATQATESPTAIILDHLVSSIEQHLAGLGMKFQVGLMLWPDAEPEKVAYISTVERERRAEAQRAMAALAVRWAAA